MTHFLRLWHTSAITTIGLFWMAFWAFGLGYLISSMIQVFVTRERMQRYMGKAGFNSVIIGTFFGFISSSCSFAALATTRSLFTKGAGLIPALAFLLASTNLVIELGIVIAVFLSWQFVVAEYIGGLLLILLMWLVVKATLTEKLEQQARKHAKQLDQQSETAKSTDWKKLILTKKGWLQVAENYVSEWQMVWKDVTIGFTVAGVIATFIPKQFFASLFIGLGSNELSFGQILAQASIGPLVAFFTFIGSMGNIPLAAVLYSKGVSFAGIIAFIFSDLIVFPILRINTKYYGWKMAIYIFTVFFFIIITSAVLMHYSFQLLHMLPTQELVISVTQRQYFTINYGLVLNIAFILLSVFFTTWAFKQSKLSFTLNKDIIEKTLLVIACIAITWLIGGLLLYDYT